jgi:hypothetical protein
MFEKYSIGEISRDQYSRILGKQERNYETITLSSYVDSMVIYQSQI